MPKDKLLSGYTTPLAQSDRVYALILSAGTAKSSTKPTGYHHVAVSSENDVYVKVGSLAQIPSQDITDGSASELNPAYIINMGTVTTISVISPVDCVVTLSFYK